MANKQLTAEQLKKLLASEKDVNPADLTAPSELTQEEQDAIDAADAIGITGIAERVSPVSKMKPLPDPSKNKDYLSGIAQGDPKLPELDPIVEPTGKGGFVKPAQAPNERLQDSLVKAGLGIGAVALAPKVGEAIVRTAPQIGSVTTKLPQLGLGSTAGVAEALNPVAEFIKANPGVIPATYIAGRSAKELYDEYQAGGPIKKAVDTYKDRMKESPSIATAVKAPEIAERVGQVAGENVIPEAGTNLLGTLGKALSGGIGGIGKGVRNVLNVSDTLAADVMGGLQGKKVKAYDVRNPETNIADSFTARVLGAIAGASDKAPAAGLVSNLAFGKDITGQTGQNTGLLELFEKPWSELSADQKEFIKPNFDAYLKFRATKHAGSFDKDTFKIEQDLRKDYESAAKPFRDASNAFSKLDNLYSSMGNQPTKGQTVSFGYNFMKTLDPNSTVRESEFSMMGDNQALPPAWQATYNQLSRAGAQFDKATATDLFDRAKEAFSASVEQQKQLEKQYSDNALRIPGTKVENVVTKYMPEKYAKEGYFKTGKPVTTEKEPSVDGAGASETVLGIPQASGVVRKVKQLEGKTPRNPERMKKAVIDANKGNASAKKYVLSEANYGK